MPQPRARFGIVLIALVLGAVRPASVLGATWDVEATLTDERKNELTADGSKVTETFEQSYVIGYEWQVNPAFGLRLDFTLDVTDELTEGPDPDSDYDRREINPQLEMEFQAVWWNLYTNWEMSEQTTDDPAQADKVDETWSVEYTFEPAGVALPEANVKFERDRTAEGGQPLTRNDRVEANLDYTFWNLLDVSATAERELQRDVNSTVITDPADDAVLAEIDTLRKDRSYQVDLTLDKDFGDRLTLEADWTNERQLTEEYYGSSYPPDGIYAGEGISRDDTLNNNLRAKLVYVPIDPLELSIDREVNWNKNLQMGTLEVVDTTTGNVNYSASLTETIDVDLEYNDERKETRGTDADSYLITKDYSAALDFAPLDNVLLSPSYDRTEKVERFEDPGASREDSVDETWEVTLDVAFWDDQVDLGLTRTYKTTVENGNETADTRNWDVDLVFSFDRVPNLVLEPQYTYTDNVDRLAGTNSIEKKVEVAVDYEVSLNDVLVLYAEHIYTRTSKDPDEGIRTVERNDDTTLNVLWSEFLSGMELEMEVNRKASDESGDDKLPQVDYTYTLSYNYEIIDNYLFTFEYEYDKKSDAEDTRNYFLSLSSEFLDGLLIVDMEYELDQQLEGDKRDTHRYLIEVQAQF